MNQINKITLSILGACNEVISMFLPIAVGLLIITNINYIGNEVTSVVLLVVAIAATIFRALKTWID